MKKCKSCKTPTRNSTYEGDQNPFNADHCQQCAFILQMVSSVEYALNQPNIQGNTRKVKLTAEISR